MTPAPAPAMGNPSHSTLLGGEAAEKADPPSHSVELQGETLTSAKADAPPPDDFPDGGLRGKSHILFKP